MLAHIMDLVQSCINASIVIAVVVFVCDSVKFINSKLNCEYPSLLSDTTNSYTDNMSSKTNRILQHTDELTDEEDKDIDTLDSINIACNNTLQIQQDNSAKTAQILATVQRIERLIEMHCGVGPTDGSEQGSKSETTV